MNQADREAAKRRMYQMLTDGASVDTVSSETGIGRKTVKAVAASLERQARDDSRERAQRLYDRGMTGAEVAGEMGIPAATIYSWLSVPAASGPPRPPVASDPDPDLAKALSEIERQRRDIARLTGELRSLKEAMIALERRFRVVIPEDMEERVRELVARDEFRREAIERLERGAPVIDYAPGEEREDERERESEVD